MVKITIEVSETVAKFLTHPNLEKRHMSPPGKVIEEALIDSLHSWADDNNWGIEQEIEEMDKEGS